MVNGMEQLLIQQLPYELIQEASSMCVEQLATSEAYEAIFSSGGDLSWRKAVLKTLLEANIRIIWENDPTCCYCAVDKDNRRLVCFFMLVPSRVMQSIGLFDIIRSGALWHSLFLGWAILNRLFITDSHTTEAKASIITAEGAEEYVELQRMVVAPERQGEGIGTYCLRSVLDSYNGSKDAPIILRTQSDLNVRFYNKW